jgi:hypothetical protein
LNYGNEGGVVEEVSVLRLHHRPSQALRVQHIGEVEQGALDARNRNPAADRELVGWQAAAAMDPHAGALDAPVLRGNGHVDQG